MIPPAPDVSSDATGPPPTPARPKRRGAAARRRAPKAMTKAPSAAGALRQCGDVSSMDEEGPARSDMRPYRLGYADAWLGLRPRGSLRAAPGDVSSAEDEPAAVAGRRPAAPSTFIARFLASGMVFAIEIYAGCMRLSGAMISAGLRVACPIERDSGAWADISLPGVRDEIISWVEAGLVWFVHLATPCTKHSRARTTGATALPTDVEDFTCRVLHAIQRVGARFALENPYGSPLFDVPGIAAALLAMGARQVVYDCCAWGADYWKRSELRTNVPQLAGLQRACIDAGDHTHEHLEGTVTFESPAGIRHTVWKTKLAGKYVPEWCHAFAGSLREVAPEGAIRKSGEASLSPCWQESLMLRAGVASRLLTVPTCPTHYSCEWAAAVSEWSHGHGKRPIPAGTGRRMTSRGL